MVKRKIITAFKQIILILTYILVKIGQVPLNFAAALAAFFSGGHLKQFFNVSNLKFTALALLIILFAYSYFFAKLIVQLPSPTLLKNNTRPATTMIYDRRGNLLYQIYDGQNRQVIKLDQVPKDLINATIAIEDKHFYSHLGVDFLAIARAFKDNLASQGVPLQGQGASTITQQLIKNTILTPKQTWQRKLKEALLAFWAERIYSKDEILQMYFNEVPYGGPAWGVEAAAQMYFGKKVHDLNLAESAYLAGLPASPTSYSPYGTHPEEGKTRQSEVLRRMVEEGYIREDQADLANSQSLSFQPPNISIKAPHFVMYVRSLLAQKYGEQTVAKGGLKVTTTLDLPIQEMAEEAVSNEIAELIPLNVGNGAAMVTNPNSGEILAMVGSKDFFDPKAGNYNAALAIRPPGSSIKVITYTAALGENFTPGTTLLDTPVTFPSKTPESWDKAYTPLNYDGNFHGPVTLRTALGSSYNIPAVKVLSLVGIPKMLATAKEMGITTFNQPQNYGLSLTLGGAGVRMIDMMTVYGTLASEGTKHEPLAILRVEDSYGNVLEDNTGSQTSEGTRVISPEVAYLLNNILSDDNARAPAFGYHSLLEISDHTVAVKTGTSDNKRDNWTFGFTKNLVVGAWVGNNDNSPMDPRLSSGITGAAPIWHQIMANLLIDTRNEAFPRPPGIVDMIVDGHKDLGIIGTVPKTVTFAVKTKKTDERTNQGSEVISYSDSFTRPSSSQTTQ